MIINQKETHTQNCPVYESSSAVAVSPGPSSDSGAKIGTAIAVVVMAIILIGLVVMWMVRRKRFQQHKAAEGDTLTEVRFGLGSCPYTIL